MGSCIPANSEIVSKAMKCGLARYHSVAASICVFVAVILEKSEPVSRWQSRTAFHVIILPFHIFTWQKLRSILLRPNICLKYVSVSRMLDESSTKQTGSRYYRSDVYVIEQIPLSDSDLIPSSDWITVINKLERFGRHLPGGIE